MAQIDIENIKRVEKNRNIVQNKVLTTYSIFQKGDNKYLQFDTYGNSNRKYPDKISQSLQFDKKGAAFLVDLLKKEFNL